MRRVFKNAVRLETYRNPYFIAGDFNGDLSQDLVAVVKPARGNSREINDELANWMLGDPIHMAISASKAPAQPAIHAGSARRHRVRVEEAEVLLAVIHGFGLKGWRDPQATQTYVLKNAAGDGIRTERYKQIVRAYFKEKLPRIWGDVIAQTVGARSGFLYYNGARYAWYDPASYTPTPPGRLVHGRISER